MSLQKAKINNNTDKLGIGSGDKAMNLAVLCGDFRIYIYFFFA